MAAPTTIARYEILNRIGRGGMGSLYLARDPKIDRLVAIKVLHADLEGDDMRIRFDREARSAGAMNHPNIVTIFDYGVFEESPYIVMEYLRGETLAELIKRKAPMPLRDKLGLLEQLCRGLAYAHEAGIIHRDIKPANLMVDQHGVLKILDFGIARLAESGLTQMSMTIGTPGYMSPEQIDGRQVERASDVFAVGAVAYELLTYRPAFGGDSQNAIIYNVLHTTPESILTVAPDVGADVAAIVTRALEKTTAARYEDAVAMQRDLQAAKEALGGTRKTPLRSTPVASRSTNPSKANLSETPTRLARLTPAVALPGKTLFESAEIALADGDTSRAHDLIDQILEDEPGRADAVALMQRVEDARVDELLSRARVGLVGQRLTEAGDFVSRALKIRPRSEAALKLQSELDSRRTDQEKRTAGRTRARVAIDRGRRHVMEGAWDAARRAADEAWALDPENPDVVDLMQAIDSGQQGGPVSYPGMELLDKTAPMSQRMPSTQPLTPITGAMALPVTRPMAMPGPAGHDSAVVAAPASRRGLWISVGVGVAAMAVIAIVLQNGKKPAAPAADTTPPVVSIASPAPNEPVQGLVHIKAVASDNSKVASVTISVDGTTLKELKKGEPYEVDWQTTDFRDGLHTIAVEAVDTAGNPIKRASLNVTATNPPPPAGQTKPTKPVPPADPAPSPRLTAEEQSKVKSLLTAADKDMNDGNYELAIAGVTQALKIDPRNSVALQLQKEALTAKATEDKKKGRGGGGL